MDALDLYEQKCGKAFVFKHYWLLLKTYPHFATIFYGRKKAGGYEILAPNVLLVDHHTSFASNGDVHDAPNLAHAEIKPPSAKSTKVDHRNMKVKEVALRANAKVTIDFVDTIMKKIEQITQQNVFILFILED